MIATAQRRRSNAAARPAAGPCARPGLARSLTFLLLFFQKCISLKLRSADAASRPVPTHPRQQRFPPVRRPHCLAPASPLSTPVNLHFNMVSTKALSRNRPEINSLRKSTGGGGSPCVSFALSVPAVLPPRAQSTLFSLGRS
jgi:hypothetical protein